MLITEKKIIRAKVHLDDAEMGAIEQVDFIADNLLTMLEVHGMTEMISPVTGEIIEEDDLRRIKGILSGLVHCQGWVLE